MEIGARLEPFFDLRLVDQIEGVEHRLHAPQAAGEAIKFDRPWEGRYCGYITVIQDEGLFRMYYRGLPQAKADGSNAETTCYAVSEDGVHWEKPNLGLYPYEGSSENNIIVSGEAPFSHNFAPFLDANPHADPHAKYKALAGISKTGLMGFASSDGVVWKKLQDEPLITEGTFDSQNAAFWSESEGKYCCYLRTWTGGDFKGYRTISRCTSEDFIHWSKPVEMDFGSPLEEHLYTNQTHPYYRAPHIYVSLAARFMPGRRILSAEQFKQIGGEASYSGDCSDTVFMTSRGGARYDRAFKESFIRPGLGLENWSSRSNYTACGVIPAGPAEMSMFVQRRYGQLDHYLERYRIRLDGFASMHANFAGGEFITKPVRFTGGKLALNVSTSAAGAVQIELQDAEGAPIDNFTLDDSDLFVGDAINAAASWKGSGDVSCLSGKPVRLRFVMKDADLYSFQFRSP
ncbi:MAG: hypothetical protein JXR73_04765 [Candidatus Omnitrophica bacterium]|nr:hypothetical protein [Candidatus Omnitrophota bacterium]